MLADAKQAEPSRLKTHKARAISVGPSGDGEVEATARPQPWPGTLYSPGTSSPTQGHSVTQHLLCFLCWSQGGLHLRLLPLRTLMWPVGDENPVEALWSRTGLSGFEVHLHK